MIETLIGAVELGGTKINVAVGTGPGKLLANARIATTTPEATLGAVVDFFRDYPSIAAIGVGAFGPVCLDVGNQAWGNITKTPKPGWADTPVATLIADALNVPVAFDTDVNTAALAEYRWGALAGCQTGLYLTVGTGIGGGLLIDGRPHHGLLHPEMGHVRIKRAPDDNFAGVCAFHFDCIEGLASGPAIEARLGHSLSEGDPDDPRKNLIYDLLGQALANYLFTISPHGIVVGGGVSKTPGFHEKLRLSLKKWVAGYIDAPLLERNDYVVAPALGDEAGVLGAIALALDMMNAPNPGEKHDIRQE